MISCNVFQQVKWIIQSDGCQMWQQHQKAVANQQQHKWHTAFICSKLSESLLSAQCICILPAISSLTLAIHICQLKSHFIASLCHFLLLFFSNTIIEKDILIKGLIRFYCIFSTSTLNCENILSRLFVITMKVFLNIRLKNVTER